MQRNPIASELRPRLKFIKSRNGCLTCKQRRIKCDETFPCQRCRKGGRECLRDPRRTSTRQLSREGEIVLVPQPRRLELDVRTATALEFFFLKTAPILQKCQPSPIWDHLLKLTESENPVIRSIAAAVGYQQKVLECYQGTAEESHKLYNAAIRSLIETFQKSTEDDLSVCAPACLLVVLLESLRDPVSAMLTHVLYSIRLFNSDQKATADIEAVYESARLIESYALSSMIFNPYNDLAVALRQALRILWSNLPITHRPGEHPEVNRLLRAITLKLISRIELSVPEAESDAETLTATLPAEDEEITRHIAALELAINECIQTFSDDLGKVAHYNFLLARSLLIGIFVRSLSLSRSREIRYDGELATFQRIVDLEESSLAQLRLASRTPALDASAPFSMGLGAMSTLAYCVTKCRDFYLRRRAMLVLNMCPPRESIWQLDEVRTFCRAIVTFEDTMAAKFLGVKVPGSIPAECRVCHFALLKDGAGKFLRVFYKPDAQADGFAQADLRPRGMESESNSKQEVSSTSSA